MANRQEERAEVDIQHNGSVCEMVFSGKWVLAAERPKVDSILHKLRAFDAFTELRIETKRVVEWDTAFLTFVRSIFDWADSLSVEYSLDELPEGASNMIRLSRAVSEEKGSGEVKKLDFFTQLGESTIEILRGMNRYFVFLGQLLIDLYAFATGRVRLRWKDFFALLHSTGPMAVVIVSLLSFLTGLIIAFIGVIQLQKFAADIYVADLVGLAVTRELGALMAGVIMSGRTGAAFAAQIGSMQVNEELDALTSFGISPIQFLVIPRVLALVIMLPLLCVCADFVGILGGMIVAVTLSEVSLVQYMYQVQAAVAFNDLMVGIFKSSVFGLIIALAGCYRGLHCGRDATAVGLATTSAVVTSITWIVIVDAVFAVIFQILSI